MIIIFDIDGTLADCTHRLHFIEGENKDWEAFFEAAKDDRPIFEIVKMCRLLWYGVKDTLCIVTGRPERTREATKKWLEDNQIRYDKLLMRKDGDHREDSEVKLEILEKIKFEIGDPVLVFEDRTQCIEMYRKNGVRCLQVVDGN